MGPLTRGGSEEVSWTQYWPGLIWGKIQASLKRQPPVAKRELWGNSGKHGNWKSCDIRSKCYDICGPRNGVCPRVGEAGWFCVGADGDSSVARHEGQWPSSCVVALWPLEH